MRIDDALVQLKDLVAHLVEEVTVVGDHEQGDAGLGQVFLQPFDHLHVEVVRWLVEDEQVRVVEQHHRQGEAFHLAAGKVAYLLLVIRKLETGQHLHETQLIRNGLGGFPFQSAVHGSGFLDHVLDGQVRIVIRKLLQIAHTDVVGEGHGAGIHRLFPDDDLQQSGFPGSVGGNQGSLVSFLDAEGDIREQGLDPIRFGDAVNAEIIHLDRGATRNL